MSGDGSADSEWLSGYSDLAADDFSFREAEVRCCEDTSCVWESRREAAMYPLYSTLITNVMCHYEQRQYLAS